MQFSKINYLQYHLNIAQNHIYTLEQQQLTPQKIEQGKAATVGIYSNIAPFAFSLQSIQTALSDPKNLLTQNQHTEFQLIGSGVFYNPNKKQILTAAHVVANKYADYKVQLSTGEQLNALVTFLDIENDIAVLELQTDNTFEDIYPLFPARELPPIGTNIISFGFQKDQIQTYVAQISANNQSLKQNSNNNFSTINTQLTSGDSGGPVMDYAGRLVGINIATKTTENKAYFLAMSEILEIIKKN